MMVEPPCQTFVGAVFEIDDRVLVAVELLAVERVAGAVHSRRVADLRIGVDRRTIEFRKDRSRRNAVETIAVIKYAKFHTLDKTLKIRGRFLIRQGT